MGTNLKTMTAWNEDRRALLRVELDTSDARAYGLDRDELRYILDPADVKGTNYPSETFHAPQGQGTPQTRRIPHPPPRPRSLGPDGSGRPIRISHAVKDVSIPLYFHRPTASGLIEPPFFPQRTFQPTSDDE